MPSRRTVFTGIVSGTGTINSVESTAAGREIRVGSAYRDLASGESIALNGVCLTVRQFGEGWFDVAAVDTTLSRTTLGDWERGTRINLERAMTATDRLGGHIVQGHVDCVGQVTGVDRDGSALLVDVSVPETVLHLMVLHGSVTVDGVSLTVNAISPGGVQLSLVDYTLRHTTLGALSSGARVNIEADLIGKYVQRLVAPYLSADRPDAGGAGFSLEH